MKKFLFLFILFGCLFLCKAYGADIDYYNELLENLTTLEKKGLLAENFIRDNETFLNRLKNEATGNYHRIYYWLGVTSPNSTTTPNFLYVGQKDSIGNVTNSSATSPNWYNTGSTCRISINGGNITGVSQPPGNDIDWLYFYSPYINFKTRAITENAPFELGGNYLSGPDLIFTPSTTKTINITSNNVTESFFNIQNSRNISYWRLGSIQGASDVSSVELNLRCIC